MLAPTLLALAALAPAAPSAPPQAVAAQAAPPARPGLSAAQRRALQQLVTAGGGGPLLGGGVTTGAGPGLQISATPVNVWQITLGDPGTGWVESVLLGVPDAPAGPNPPLLVMFHGWGVSEWDCYVHTTLFEDALARGWYVIAPLGANQQNWGLPYAQQNVEYALTLLANQLPIDPTRIYGVGFSMGGGALMSYAARHQDLDQPRFAAVVNHTGSTSVAHVHANVANPSGMENPLLFGGPPSTYPFLYAQASVFDLDPVTDLPAATPDLARNLAHVAVRNHHALGDPLQYLAVQTARIHAWLSWIVGAPSEQVTSPLAQHAWSTLDEAGALDFLQSKTLQTPAAGQHRLLADREASWFHFYVYQDAPGAFTPLRWTMDPASNSLTIDQTENLARVVVDTASIGLDTAVDLDLVMQSSDGGTEVTTLTGYAQPPAQVLRNGAPTTSWTWDPNGETVTLTETSGGAGATWRVRP